MPSSTRQVLRINSHLAMATEVGRTERSGGCRGIDASGMDSKAECERVKAVASLRRLTELMAPGVLSEMTPYDGTSNSNLLTVGGLAPLLKLAPLLRNHSASRSACSLQEYAMPNPREPTTPENPGDLPHLPDDPATPAGPNDIPADNPDDERRHKEEDDQIAATGGLSGWG